MREYDPALHIFNWAMNDGGLYSRFQDFVDYIRRNLEKIHSIANTANSLAEDTAKKAIKCNDFDPEYNTADVKRDAASLFLKEAEELSGAMIK